MINKQKAIDLFLVRVEQLDRLPLVTDAEMQGLYGAEVIAALDELERFNRQERLCDECAARCCPAIHCELYAPQFKQCPIHGYRPVVCRMHFCHRFFPRDDTPLKEICDVFFDSLLAAERLESKCAPLFDAPPMFRCCASLVDAVSPLVSAVREGKLDPEEAMASIQAIAAGWRTPTEQSAIS